MRNLTVLETKIITIAIAIAIAMVIVKAIALTLSMAGVEHLALMCNYNMYRSLLSVDARLCM